MYVAAGTALFVLLVTTVRSIYRPRGVTRMSGYFRHHLGDSYCDRLVAVLKVKGWGGSTLPSVGPFSSWYSG